MSIKLSVEQQAISSASRTGETVASSVGARTAKTSTLPLIADADSDDPALQGFSADAAVVEKVRPRIEADRPIRPPMDDGIANSGGLPSSSTWFERNNVEPRLVERAAQHIYACLDPKAALELAVRSGGDRQFAVWLHLTDEHCSYLPSSAPSREETDWRRLYQAGMSPYGAVIEVRERSEERPAQPVRLTAEHLDRLTGRGVEL